MLATSNVVQAVKGNLLSSIFSAPKSEPALKKSGGLFDESDEDDLFGEPPPPVQSKNGKKPGMYPSFGLCQSQWHVLPNF